MTDTERRIAYNYEMQMCRTGKNKWCKLSGFFVQGIEVDGDSVDSIKSNLKEHW